MHVDVLTVDRHVPSLVRVTLVASPPPDPDLAPADDALAHTQETDR